MMVFFPAGTWSTHWTSTWKWTTFSSTSTTVWGAATSRHSSGYRKLTASLTGSRSLNHMGALWHTSWQPLYILLLNHVLSTRFDENLLFFQIQEKPEDSLRGSSYKLHQNRLQHFQTTDQVKKEKKNPTSSKLCCFTDPVSHVTSTVSFSHKFGKKLKNVNFLDELREHVNFEQLIIPSDVLRWSVAPWWSSPGRPTYKHVVSFFFSGTMRSCERFRKVELLPRWKARLLDRRCRRSSLASVCNSKSKNPNSVLC